MQISVIIPTLNESETLEGVIETVASAERVEIIVADGGSRDDTLHIARRLGARVVQADTGRGVQMNAGAREANGPVLLFLHADTLLPRGWQDSVCQTLQHRTTAAGAFGLTIDGPGWGLRLVERAVAWRCRIRQRPYGDQGIFMRADDFRDIGGFRDIPVMEDFDLIRRVRALGRVITVSKHVVTSARRWASRGVWRTTLSNQLCIWAYQLGISPHRIARWRRASSQPVTQGDSSRSASGASAAGASAADASASTSASAA